MRLFPQVACALTHWGAVSLPEGEPALRRTLAASTQQLYAKRFGLPFYESTARAHVKGQLPLEPVFLVVAPALLQGPEVGAWVRYWFNEGHAEMQLAAMYGSIFLEDEGEGMGFLVQHMLQGGLRDGIRKAAEDLMEILKDLRTGRCTRCKLLAVGREALPKTWIETRTT